MEASAAVELFTNVTKSNVKFSTYAGDDDSTTELHLKQKVPYRVEKWSDTVHIKRSLTTRLYNLSQRSKFPNCSTLSQKVINYLVKCFTYCIAQNKGNHTKMTTGMQNIVPHAFGDHRGCDESWCGSKKDPENYNHKDLPSRVCYHCFPLTAHICFFIQKGSVSSSLSLFLHSKLLN